MTDGRGGAGAAQGREQPDPGRAPAAGTGSGGRSDEDLLAAYVDGDDAGFDTLVTRYERRVYAICYRYFHNPEDAEDAAQEAFIALLRRAGTFSGASSFSTWMYRVAVNACNDLARRRARRPQRTDEDVTQHDALFGAAASAEEVLAARGLPAELVTALQTLDDDTREAVVLHDVYHVPYHEIAARRGVAVGTVKSRVHRGHARLAATLQHAAPGAEPSGPGRPPTKQR